MPGSHVSFSAVLEVSRLPTAAERAAKLEEVMTTPVSVRELRANIEAQGSNKGKASRSGRKVTVPKSPLAAAHAAIKSSQRCSKFFVAVLPAICDQVDSMSATNIDTALLARLQEFQCERQALRKQLDDWDSRLATSIARVQKVTAARAAEAGAAVVNAGRKRGRGVAAA
jgi:hypothetical protein